MPRPTVGIVNGDRITFTDLCPAVHIIIRDEVFIIDLYIVTVDGYEMVLSYQWLSTPGPILWDFGPRTMSF